MQEEWHPLIIMVNVIDFLEIQMLRQASFIARQVLEHEKYNEKGHLQKGDPKIDYFFFFHFLGSPVSTKFPALLQPIQPSL